LSAAAFSAAAFATAALAAAALDAAALAAATRAAFAAEELRAAARLSAARLSAANADAFSLGAGGVVDTAAEVGGDAGFAVTTERDPQATVTKRMSTHRIAPLIVRNTPIPRLNCWVSLSYTVPRVKLR
jgi:hypothetical protein